MRPVDTIHKRNLFFDSLDSPYMERYFDIWINRDPAARHSFPEKLIAGRVFPWSGREVCDNIKRQLQMTEAWYASADVIDVVEAMRQQMPPEVMHQQDPPSTHGFLLLEKPWIQHDVHGKAMPLRAILWATRSVGKGEGAGPGVLVWGLIDLDDRVIDEYWTYGEFTEEAARGLLREGLNLTPAVNYSLTFGAYGLEMVDQPGTWIVADSEHNRVEPTDEPGVWHMVADASLREVVALPGYSMEADIQLANSGSRRVRPEPIISFLQCLWRFQSQEIVAVEREHLRKTLARHLQRRQILPSPVSIIKWRKRARSEETGEQHFQYSHRFIVRGHWRRQWYASEQRHRSIYIRPHVKGPDDAPLLQRERVNAVVR